MRKALIALAIAATAVATPAMANEGRAEVRGGVVWDSGVSDETYGIAVGYDWDLGDKAFVGVEFSGDKAAAGPTGVVLGATARLGFKATDKIKAFADGGYSLVPCQGCENAVHAGAGVEVGVGEKAYVKVAYRHFFVGNGFSDYDAAYAGIGVRF